MQLHVVVAVQWQGEEEAMFLEYRKELRVIFNNLGALVSHFNVTNTDSNELEA